MANGLTRKQKKYVINRVKGMNGTEAALDAYETKDKPTAAVISTENLSKPKIIDELKRYGFNEDSAKNVVIELMNDKYQEGNVRLSAAKEVFKVFGTYAAEKTLSLTANANVDELKAMIQKDIARFKGLTEPQIEETNGEQLT